MQSIDAFAVKQTTDTSMISNILLLLLSKKLSTSMITNNSHFQLKIQNCRNTYIYSCYISGWYNILLIYSSMKLYISQVFVRVHLKL